MHIVHLVPKAETSVEMQTVASSPRPLESNFHASDLGVHSAAVQQGRGVLAGLIRTKALHPVFQPIVSLRDGSVYSHEALVRGPQRSALHTPDALLAAAKNEKLNFEFEVVCISVALERWGCLHESGRLFVNISAEVLLDLMRLHGRDGLVKLVNSFGVMPRMLVLEITEYERVDDMDSLTSVAHDIRSAGVSLALDDFGDGRSSLRLWAQVRPEIVKIDKFFTKHISQHGHKVKTIQSLQQIAAIFDTALVAEGIETEDDLRVLRDLGIHYGQGYFLGRPALLPLDEIDTNAVLAMRDPTVAVLPELTRSYSAGMRNRMTILDAPTVGLLTTNIEVAEVFAAQPDLHALAVIDGARPVGIINRSHFMSEFSKLYYREVWGHKHCTRHINFEPRVVEREHHVDHALGILTSEDQRYLTDGVIVTDNGRYVGLGTGEQLVRSVTEARIEAARHANPLTYLPGNVPISQHIERLLRSGVEFVACYADLNNFKPFNDQYGYWRGDQMILLAAKVITAHCDRKRDFVGHVGGDDFIMLYQSADWRMQCELIVTRFADRAVELFDPPAREAGGIHAEDRHGVTRFFALTTLSIGAVRIRAGDYATAEEVASVAARAKHHAKTQGEGFWMGSEGGASV